MKVADLVKKLQHLDPEVEVLMDVLVCEDETELRPVLDVVPVTGRIEDGVFCEEEGGVTGYRLVEDPTADHIRQANAALRRAERRAALPPTDPVIVALCDDW